MAAAIPAASALIGAGAAAGGFAPFNDINSHLDLAARPWVVVAMPAVLVAALALTAALLAPAHRARPLPHGLTYGALLLLTGAGLSVLASDNPERSATLVVLAISAPIGLFLGVYHARLDHRYLLGGFLAATALMLLRADAIFLRDWGLPTGGKLEAAKFQNVPYDFHYYTLGNPDHTGGFLLMPLVVSAFWAARRDLDTRLRAALGLVALICLGTLILTYARFAIVSGIVALAVLAVVVPADRRTRMFLVGGVGTVLVAFGAVAFSYLLQLFDTDRTASVPERFSSLEDGLVTLGNEPLTGIGLGQYSADVGYFPAHSSIAQAGAEMGVLGFAAIVLLTVSVVVLAVHMIRGRGWLHLSSITSLAVAGYAIHAAAAAPSSSGLFSGYTSVWGMTAALLLGVAVAREDRDGP